jgi:NADPH:quinone reductase-like Zn-dependent oxidoreductase
MSTNQAAWLDGKDARLRVAEAPMPTAEEGKVVIKNKAVAVSK